MVKRLVGPTLFDCAIEKMGKEAVTPTEEEDERAPEPEATILDTNRFLIEVIEVANILGYKCSVHGSNASKYL